MRLLEDPQICPSSYSFHAYCRYENSNHEYGEFPHINSQCATEAQAKAQLRAYGWMFHRDGTGTCPTCTKQLNSTKRVSTKGIRLDQTK